MREEAGGPASECERWARCGKVALNSSKSLPSGFCELVLGSGQRWDAEGVAGGLGGSPVAKHGRWEAGGSGASLCASRGEAVVADEVGVGAREQVLPQERSRLRSSHNGPGPGSRLVAASDGAFADEGGKGGRGPRVVAHAQPPALRLRCPRAVQKPRSSARARSSSDWRRGPGAREAGGVASCPGRVAWPGWRSGAVARPLSRPSTRPWAYPAISRALSVVVIVIVIVNGDCAQPR